MYCVDCTAAIWCTCPSRSLGRGVISVSNIGKSQWVKFMQASQCLPGVTLHPLQDVGGVAALPTHDKHVSTAQACQWRKQQVRAWCYPWNLFGAMAVKVSSSFTQKWFPIRELTIQTSHVRWFRSASQQHQSTEEAFSLTGSIAVVVSDSWKTNKKNHIKWNNSCLQDPMIVEYTKHEICILHPKTLYKHFKIKLWDDQITWKEKHFFLSLSKTSRCIAFSAHFSFK